MTFSVLFPITETSDPHRRLRTQRRAGTRTLAWHGAPAAPFGATTIINPFRHPFGVESISERLFIPSVFFHAHIRWRKLCLSDTHVHGPRRGKGGGVFCIVGVTGSSIVCACGMFGSGYPIPLRGMRFFCWPRAFCSYSSPRLGVRWYVRIIHEAGLGLLCHFLIDWAFCAKDGCIFDRVRKKVVNVNGHHCGHVMGRT